MQIEPRVSLCPAVFHCLVALDFHALLKNIIFKTFSSRSQSTSYNAFNIPIFNTHFLGIMYHTFHSSKHVLHHIDSAKILTLFGMQILRVSEH